MTPRLHVLHVPGVDPDRDAIVAKLQTEADVCLHLDPKRKGLMQNWLAALVCAYRTDQDFKWSFILSDDADPYQGWKENLKQACEFSPEPILGLTHFGSYGLKALDKGAPFGVGPYLLWGGGIAYRRDILKPLLEFAIHVYNTTGYPHDDCLAAAFAMRNGHETAMTARALFGQPITKSLLGHHTPIRFPASTIETHSEPLWNAERRYVRVSRPIDPKGELERLAAL